MGIKVKNRMSGPIVIGALGGSGTRVVAQILIDSGIFMGDTLNSSNDNLTFTRLFKRPKWYSKANDAELKKHLITFEKYMLGKKWNHNDIKIYLKGLFIRGDIDFEILNDLSHIFLFLIKPKRNFNLWGWKEPNTHIFLKDLNQYFNSLKYIHVIRHGLDMAYSRNIQQLYHWGWLYEVKIPENKNLIPRAQLEYWIRANKQAIMTGKQLLGNRFFLQNFEELCINPKNEIEKLLNFLNIEVNEDVLRLLISLPSLPPTFFRMNNKRRREQRMARCASLSAIATIFTAVRSFRYTGRTVLRGCCTQSRRSEQTALRT